MILGRVVGEVWAARRDARLMGAKLLVVRPHAVYEPAFPSRHLVATDEVHAGIGDEVVVRLGAPARWSAGGNDLPVDAAVLGVVDRVDLVGAPAVAAAGAGPGIARPLELGTRSRTGEAPGGGDRS